MQIKLQLKIFIFLLFFFLTNQITIYIELMIFALIHEIGHMLIGIILGLKAQKLEIMPVGFAISFKIDTENYNKKVLKGTMLSLKKLLIAIAGPTVNLIFIVLFLKLKLNEELIYINIMIFIFNMMPIYPLDGGRVIKYIISIFFGKKTAIFVSHIISNITCIIMTMILIILTFIFQNIAYSFIIIYILIVTIKENKKYRMKAKLYKILENNIAINNY